MKAAQRLVLRDQLLRTRGGSVLGRRPQTRVVLQRVITTTGFATRLTKKGSELAECSVWDIDSGGSTTILSVIKTDSTTGAPKSETDVVTFGSSGKVFVGKLTAKY